MLPHIFGRRVKMEHDRDQWIKTELEFVPAIWLWYHFGVGAPPILVYFSGGWDVRWGYVLLTMAISLVHFFSFLEKFL